MPVIVGTSGWQYADWRGDFYPEQLASRHWLEYYAAIFPSVEIDGSFYRLPERATFERWRDQTPQGFVFSVKASRFLTHVRRLREPREPVARLMDRLQGLGDRLGPVLLQLPPNLRIDHDALDATLASFPDKVRVAVELRHESWFIETTKTLLERHNAALCYADSRGLRTPTWQTADWGYVRLHEGRSDPRPCYGNTALRSWVERLLADERHRRETFVYFNNDTNCCAPRNARTFARMCHRAGLGGGIVNLPTDSS